MDPPDCCSDAAQAAAYQPGPGPSNKRSRETAPSEGDFLTIGREIQNRSGHRVGSDLSEDGRFRSFFGCGAEVTVICWTMLVTYSLLPDDAQIVHFLWALYFMKVYPAGNVGASTAGGSGGAVDVKTFRLHLWPMIRAISDLEMHVVSLW